MSQTRLIYQPSCIINLMTFCVRCSFHPIVLYHLLTLRYFQRNKWTWRRLTSRRWRLRNLRRFWSRMVRTARDVPRRANTLRKLKLSLYPKAEWSCKQQTLRNLHAFFLSLIYIRKAEFLSYFNCWVFITVFIFGESGIFSQNLLFDFGVEFR